MNRLAQATPAKGFCLALSLTCAVPVNAQTVELEPATSSLQPAAGTEVWASTDSDGTQVLKVLSRALWNFEGREKFAGIAVEHAWFQIPNGKRKAEDRLYLDLADHLGRNWRWRARVGTDGDTVLGSAELRRADWSRSFFIEREIVETEQGLNRKIYYTFLGGSTDISINGSNTISLTTGLQEFTGKNERLHLRGRYVHVLNSDSGLSAQLDARYYHSTHPGEFDYFSPKDFLRVLPLLQMRQFSDNGWMYLVAGGIGVQHSTGGDWKAARFAQLRLESPRTSFDLDTFGEIIYTNDSLSAGANYDYLLARAGVTLRF